MVRAERQKVAFKRQRAFQTTGNNDDWKESVRGSAPAFGVIQALEAGRFGIECGRTADDIPVAKT